MVYTIAERVEMVFCYGAEKSFRRVAAFFNERHPDKNVSHVYVRELIRKFQETGSVANIKRNQPTVVDEAAQIEILGQFAINPTMSTRRAATATGIS